MLKLQLVSEQRQIRLENKQAKAKEAASKVRRVASARKEPGVAAESAVARQAVGNYFQLGDLWAFHTGRWRGLEASRALRISRTKSC